MKEYTFLVEIGTESLPSRILKKLGGDFFYQIISNFKKYNVFCSKSSWFASACRLAVKSKIMIKDDMDMNVVCVKKIGTDTTYNKHNKCVYDRITEVSNNNLSIDNNMKINDNFHKKLRFYENVTVHQSLRNLLYVVISSALDKLKHYEMMRWGDVNIAFVRPVRTVTILLDAHLIPGCFFGVSVNRILYGNRCMEEYEIILEHADNYPDVLISKGRVLADYEVRKNIIRMEIEKEAKKLGGSVDIQYNNLLEEVTAQVEWPIILSGKFDEKFLELPQEVIFHIMRHDQKYFPVYNRKNGMLLPYFIFVANTVSDNYRQIIIGHEQVIKPRLMDAEFFLRNDNKYRLEEYMPRLNSVLFHRRLGTLHDKSLRIATLSSWIADQIGEDVQQAERAGYLCKCDLMSDMVSEFPSTQGIIGMYYAFRDGELDNVALAQKEHYHPRFFDDQLPTTPISCIISIADKIDTISGIFGIKELPKGNRDPFALKRSAIGILRVLVYKQLPLNLIDLIQKSVVLYGSQLINETVINDIYNFMYSRLYSWYCTRGYRTDIVKAVLDIGIANVVDINARIKAISDFCKLQPEENIKLNLVYKRISNILLTVQMSYDGDVNPSLLITPEESHLSTRIIAMEKQLQLLCVQYRYYDALIMVTDILNAVNVFFSNVVIMDKDKSICINRLILLNKVKKLFLKIVDVSLLQF